MQGQCFKFDYYDQMFAQLFIICWKGKVTITTIEALSIDDHQSVRLHNERYIVGSGLFGDVVGE